MAKLETGRVVGSYRVLRCIGQGGMGTVYEVEHIELGVHYALKTFTFDPADEHAETLKTKFLEEGKVLARLKHPNIAHVFDLSFDEKTQMPYFVMDLVTYSDGESYTAEDVDPNDIDEDMIYGWFKELASALDYIHGEGIVHRDIKPTNLLLDKDLHVVLADFGISRIFGGKIKTDVEASQTMVTKTGRGKLVLGTEKYMAPEVSKGEEATPAADAYSLGVMTLRWLTGFYYSDNPGALAMLSKKKYKWLPVIAKLLAPASRRPAKLGEMVKMLKLGEHLPEKKPTHAAPPAKAPKRRNALRIVFMVVFWLAAVAGASWFGYQGWLHYEQMRRDEKRASDAKLAELQRQVEESRREQAEAEKRRAEEEKVRQAKEEEKRKQAEERRKRAEEERQRLLAATAIPAQNDNQQEQQQEEKKKKRRQFVDNGSNYDEETDFGPIPDKPYFWFRGGDKASPIAERFLLANQAIIDLIPFRPTSFYMTNADDSERGWHKVTFTRPFWMSKTCVTVAQWREFAENDCEDCREIEKALDNQALLYIKLPRKSIDAYCAFLTAKYRSQLPKGYVFRLPSEAEWEYVLDNEATVMKYHQPHVKDWPAFVHTGGETFQKRFAGIRNGKKELEDFNKDGSQDRSRYHIGGLAMPQPSGVQDMYCWFRWVLDKWPRRKPMPYADHETDPLHWQEGEERWSWAREWERRREGRGAHDNNLCHIVLGPDLVGEKAWKNERENIIMNARVPQQRHKFDVKKIPSKISKPREVSLKRVGGKDMWFCEIPKGKFNMSNVEGQEKRNHRVELTRPFWMTKYCVTADEWREFAPNDFMTHAVLTTEKLFGRKYPICINTTYHRWTAYCEFLTKRYGHLLPAGYVFRLPTEAEWEWAFIADEKNSFWQMRGGMYCADHGRLRDEFNEMLKKLHTPAGLHYDSMGFAGNAYVGGRTQETGFGVCDIIVHAWRNMLMLDTFDAQRDDQLGWDRNANPIKTIVYPDSGTVKDPVHYAGRCANFYENRHWKRELFGAWHWGVAHIVIGPDVLKPLKEQEVATFPMQDFGGVFLGDSIMRADQSSKQEEWRNDELRFKRLISRENVIVDRFDKRQDTRGFHTQYEDSPWIMLDLGKRRKVTGLAIDALGCHDGWHDPRVTRNLCIWASDDGEKRTLIDKEDIVRQRYRIDLQRKNVTTRYLIIGREPKCEKNWFFLDKIVVYGK